MSPAFRSLLLRVMLDAYKDWKHPTLSMYKTAKGKQDAKNRFYKWKKKYTEVRNATL